MSVLCCVHHWSSLFFNQLSSFPTAFLQLWLCRINLGINHSLVCSVQSRAAADAVSPGSLVSAVVCLSDLSVDVLVMLCCSVLCWFDHSDSTADEAIDTAAASSSSSLLSSISSVPSAGTSWREVSGCFFLLLMLQRTTLCLAVFSH